MDFLAIELTLIGVLRCEGSFWGHVAIPSPAGWDSPCGLLVYGKCDSPWKTQLGFPWRHHDGFRKISTAAGFVRLPVGARTVFRSAVFYLMFNGSSRTDAARLGGVGFPVIRDWVVRFNADGPEDLVDRKAPGTSSPLRATERVAPAAQIEGLVQSGTRARYRGRGR